MSKSPLLWENYDGTNYDIRKKIGKFLIYSPIVIFVIMVLSQLIIDEWLMYDIYNMNGGNMNDNVVSFVAEPNQVTVFDFQCENKSPYHIKLDYSTDNTNINLRTEQSPLIEKGVKKYLTIRVSNETSEQQIVSIQVSGGMAIR